MGGGGGSEGEEGASIAVSSQTIRFDVPALGRRASSLFCGPRESSALPASVVRLRVMQLGQNAYKMPECLVCVGLVGRCCGLLYLSPARASPCVA